MLFAKRLGLFIGLLMSTGCYTYQPVRASDVVMGVKVRATVSASQAAELAPVLRNVTPQVTGTVSERDPESIMVDVALRGATQGMSQEVMYNRVRIPMTDLVSLEERKISTWRTAVVVGALAVGIGSAWAIVSDNQTSADKPGGGTDNAVRIRIPIGFGFR